MTTRNLILKLEKVRTGYGRQPVLLDVDFCVHSHDFIGIVGPNGSGKTTLLKVILGLLPPWSGIIRYFRGGSEVERFSMGYMPQSAQVDPDFPITVKDVVRSGLMTRDANEPGDIPVQRVMQRMGIAALGRRPLGELSGGQRQRVFLARAIVASPPLLLLDEPDTYADRDFGRNFHELLTELNRDMAILMVSHDLGMIASQVQSIACVNGSLYHHESSEITQELMESYRCPIDLITHGRVPHRVLKSHQDNNSSLPKRNHHD
ncbi:MAG TPA: ATP-binding cassette domain-containing protein [Candidatus Aminicenantes bacterium]|nr:ATP-binding cassette domain-containing protein [Candidatus Aminicenantes bacterium]